MVINDFHVFRAFHSPNKAHAPLIVDANAVLPLAISFQRFQLIDVASDSHVILTLALDNTPPGGRVPVILDVDAFRVKDLDLSSPELWDILEKLRELKNRCFFGTITEATAELYE